MCRHTAPPGYFPQSDLFAAALGRISAWAFTGVRELIFGIRVEFGKRELHFPEGGAGIVVAAGFAFLFRQAEMAGGEHELNAAFHSDDRKDTDGNILSLIHI